jgi:hypothetical protein
MSTLATVVGSDEQIIADWNSHKASLDAPLTQFHAKFWGVEEEGRLRDNMEVEDSTADDHEISPRCYVLDIGIRGLEDKIWVRAEYIKMFEYAEKFYAEILPKPMSPCLVITGQPGIGEFCWCYYPCTTDISDIVSRQNSLALVRVASVLCAKKTSYLLYEWDLLVVR